MNSSAKIFLKTAFIHLKNKRRDIIQTRLPNEILQKITKKSSLPSSVKRDCDAYAADILGITKIRQHKTSVAIVKKPFDIVALLQNPICNAVGFEMIGLR